MRIDIHAHKLSLPCCWCGHCLRCCRTDRDRPTVGRLAAGGSPSPTPCSTRWVSYCLLTMLREVKNVTWRQRMTNELLYAGLPIGSRPQVEIGALGSAVITGGVKMKLLAIWFCGNRSMAKGASEDRLAHLLICWRQTPGSPETVCRQRGMTGLARGRELWTGGRRRGRGRGRLRSTYY